MAISDSAEVGRPAAKIFHSGLRGLKPVSDFFSSPQIYARSFRRYLHFLHFSYVAGTCYHDGMWMWSLRGAKKRGQAHTYLVADEKYVKYTYTN